MNHREGYFKGTRNLELYYQSWHPEGTAQALVVIVHGMGAHSGWFGTVVQALVPKHYTIYSFDLRGNGRSPGQRGHIDAWSEFREDLHAFMGLVRGKEPGCPVFLLGHSLGAAIVLDYVLRYPAEATTLQGVIALAPTLGQLGVPPLKLLVGNLLSRVLPRFTLSTGLDLSTGSRDPDVLAAFAQDPLRHNRASARLATEYLATVDWIQAHAADWHTPLLILHGSADRVALPESGKIFFQKVCFPDKERRDYPGGYHEPHNDLDYPDVLADLADWLERHLLPARTESKGL